VTKYSTGKRKPVKKDILERKYVAAKVAKFWLFFLSAWQALFVFFLLLFFVPKIGGLPPQTFSPFFNTVFSFCLIFFVSRGCKVSFMFCSFLSFFCAFFVPFFVPFFCCVEGWMRLRDMVDPHLFFCSTVKNHENFDYLFRLTPLCLSFFSRYFSFLCGRISVCVDAQGHEST
jgi:hypothetical protein